MAEIDPGPVLDEHDDLGAEHDELRALLPPPPPVDSQDDPTWTGE